MYHDFNFSIKDLNTKMLIQNSIQKNMGTKDPADESQTKKPKTKNGKTVKYIFYTQKLIVTVYYKSYLCTPIDLFWGLKKLLFFF